MLIFDLDYTLLDSSKGIIKSVNKALENIGLRALDNQIIKNSIIFLKIFFIYQHLTFDNIILLRCKVKQYQEIKKYVSVL